MHRTVGLLAVLAASCAPDWGQHTQAITDGTEHDGHPSVGRLKFILNNKDSACTATLIGESTVLTAAHCLGFDNSQFELAGVGLWDAMTQVVHPDYDPGQPWEYDLGLILLADTPAVDPSALSPRPPEMADPVTLIGYGETEYEVRDDDVKRLATNEIDSVEDLYFVISGSGNGRGNACRGDSGGPVLVDVHGREAITGLLSWVPGLSNGCGRSVWSTRLDLYVDWITMEAQGDVRSVDVEPPTVQIESPPDRSILQSPFELRVAVSDDRGVSTVEVLVDDTVIGSKDQAPYVFELSPQIGTHQVLVVATDEIGNEGSASIMVAVEEKMEPKTEGPAVESSGCSVASGDRGSLLLLLLGVLLLRKKP